MPFRALLRTDELRVEYVGRKSAVNDCWCGRCAGRLYSGGN